MGKKVKKRTTPMITARISSVSKEEKEARIKVIDNVISTINKEYGEEVVVRGSNLKQAEIIRVPTVKIPSLDFAIGGGLPMARTVTISGHFSACKTAVGLASVAAAQEQGYTCALIDVEGTYTESWGEALGIDNELLIYNRPENAEEGTNVAIRLAEMGISVILLDSVEALSPQSDMDKGMEENAKIGLKATLMGRFLRRMNAINNRCARRGEDGILLILLNQLRERPMTMGDPEYETGGRAIGFYSSIQIRLRRSDYIKTGEGKNQRIVGQTVKFKVNKNKTYKMLQTGEFDFYTDDSNPLGLPQGSFDSAKQLIIEGIAWGIIKSPAQGYYLVNGQKVHGMDNTIQLLRDDLDLAMTIQSQIASIIKAQSVVSVEGELEERKLEDAEKANNSGLFKTASKTAKKSNAKKGVRGSKGKASKR